MYPIETKVDKALAQDFQVLAGHGAERAVSGQGKYGQEKAALGASSRG
jgi:hypothetical protein